MFFQILLLDESHRTFFMETGKQMITGIMVKANKVKHIFFGSFLIHTCPAVTNNILYLLFIKFQSPKAFLESYEDMLLYTQREETWPVTQIELEGRGVSSAECIYVCISSVMYFN